MTTRKVRRIVWILLASLLCGIGAVRADACAAYYPFDGTLNDASGNGYHGLLIPEDGDRSAQFVEGRRGQALRLSNGTAMHSFIDLHYDFCPQVTFTGWIRLPAAAVAGNQYVFSTGAGDGPGLFRAERKPEG